MARDLKMVESDIPQHLYVNIFHIKLATVALCWCWCPLQPLRLTEYIKLRSKRPGVTLPASGHPCCFAWSSGRSWTAGLCCWIQCGLLDLPILPIQHRDSNTLKKPPQWMLLPASLSAACIEDGLEPTLAPLTQRQFWNMQTFIIKICS